MPSDHDRRAAPSPRGPLSRLNREREALAKSWLVRLIERSSLDEIKDLPTDRLAAEMPDVISDIVEMVSREEGGADLSAAARARTTALVDLRGGAERSVADITYDIGAIQGVMLAGLARDSGDLSGAEVAKLAERIAEAVGGIQSAAVDYLLERLTSKLKQTANSDALTGLSNRHHLTEQLKRASELHKRYETPFSLLVLDVDGLKRVNDSQGHQAGDRVLVQVATALQRMLRSTDTAARIGGDEFCVIASNQTAESAELLARRLAEAVKDEVAGDSGVGVSIGVASCPEHGEDTEELIAKADQAMYRAKAGGESVALGDPDQPELIKIEKTQTK